MRNFPWPSQHQHVPSCSPSKRRTVTSNAPCPGTLSPRGRHFSPLPKKQMSFGWWKHRSFPTCDGSRFSVVGHKHQLKRWGILNVTLYKLPHAEISAFLSKGWTLLLC